MKITAKFIIDYIKSELNKMPQEIRSYGFEPPVPPIQIGDLTVSVQASKYHYCNPQRNYSEDPDIQWVAVEVGYPSKTPPDSFLEFQDGEVYASVPIGLVAEWLSKEYEMTQSRLLEVPDKCERKFE